MKKVIEELEKICNIPCQCNCGPVHSADCAKTIALSAISELQKLDKLMPIISNVKLEKCPWCGGQIETGHTEISGIGSGCHTVDVYYQICGSDNICGYYSISDTQYVDDIPNSEQISFERERDEDHKFE